MNKSILILGCIAAVFAAGCSDNKAAEKKAAPSTPAFQLATIEEKSVEEAVKLPAQLAGMSAAMSGRVSC
jgi:hypothetical protein